MNMTSVAFFPAAARSVTVLPDTASVSEKAGIFVPSGSMVEGVSAIVISLGCVMKDPFPASVS
jgi:hypothetical protein